MSISTVRQLIENACPSIAFLLFPDEKWSLVAMYSGNYAEIRWSGTEATVEYDNRIYQCESCNDIVKKTVTLLTGNESGLTRYLD